jgi:lipoate-protein ligase B
MSRRLDVVQLGRHPYGEVLDLQRALCRGRADGECPNDMLLLVEHPPVFTLGRSARAASLPVPAALLVERGAEVHEVERGGDVTFHGPGQLVGYPIVDLRRHREDLHWYLRELEAVLIESLAEFGVVGERSAGRTGVWTGGRKIASIGVHVKRWVTLHGFALNVSTDLSWFDLIVPCGIPGVRMTSISAERQVPTGLEVVGKAVSGAFARRFDLEPVQVAAGTLRTCPAVQVA